MFLTDTCTLTVTHQLSHQAKTMYLHNADSSTTGHPTQQLGHWKPSSQFLRYRQKNSSHPNAACQNHCSSKVICSKVHYHHHLWWWIPYDGGSPAAASTHNDILLLLAVTPHQMAHSQQPACQTEHTQYLVGSHCQKWCLKYRLHLWEGHLVQSS